MKILNSTHINPFGGINFVFEEFNRLKIDKILSDSLPTLPAQSRYNWKDLLYSFWSIYFCGGNCIEDLSINLGHHLKNNPLVKIPSPDRVLNRFKELAIPEVLFSVPRGTSLHQFSLHIELNELNIKILKKIGLHDLTR